MYGRSLTFVPTWAPPGVVPSHWWSETCACGTDDNRLVVQFKRQRTRLDWVVSDQHEYRRVRAGIVCHDGRFAARVINGRTVFYRPDTETAWMCIPGPAGARWYPSVGRPIIVPLGKLTISVRQVAGPTGRLQASDLERMVAGAHPSPAGRPSSSRYELPSQNDVTQMAAAFRRPLVLPTRLPAGFIYSDWRVSPRVDNVDPRRELTVTFGRDSLFTQIVWAVHSGVDSFGFDCTTKDEPPRQAVINGRPIYANEGIHG